MFVLKLSEKTVGERMLVACLYQEDKTEYEEHMKCVIQEEYFDNYCRAYITWEERAKLLNAPLTTQEEETKEKLRKEFARYQGKFLEVGSKLYPIHDANKDFWFDAPEILLTEEEVAEWRKEFCGNNWDAFDDELFLK